MTDLVSQAKAFKEQVLPALRASPDAQAHAAALSLTLDLIQAGESAFALELIESMEASRAFPAAALELAVLRLQALATLGRRREALGHWEAWYAAHAGEIEPAQRSAVLRGLNWASHCRWGLNMLTQAEMELTQIYGELRQMPDSENLGWCALNLGNVAWARGNLTLTDHSAQA